MIRRTDRLDTALSAGIFVVCLAYFVLFQRLGWFPQDEGVLYYQYLRTFEGQVPYRDFYTGYPPLVYYLYAWVFAHIGISTDIVRGTMAVVNSISAVALYAVTRRIAARPFALIPPILFAVMQPGDITSMGFHNSPYPSWFAITFATLGAWALLRSLETPSAGRRSAWLAATGALAGLTFLSKQNAGIFLLWGVTGFLASHPDPAAPARTSEPALGRAARAGYLALIPLASLYLVKNYLSPVTLAAFVSPVAILAWMGIRRPFDRAALRRLALDFDCLGLGFALAFGPWLILFARKVGLGGFLRGLFFVGSNVDRNLYIPFAPPLVATILVMVPMLVWAFLARTRRKGHRTPRFLVPATVAFLLGAALSQTKTLQDSLALQFGLGEICILTSTFLDNLALYLSLFTFAAALLVATRQARGGLPGAEGPREGDPPAEAFLAILWMAACTYLLLYPRMDAAHVASAVPLLYAVGAGLLPLARIAFLLPFAGSGERTARAAFHAICLLAVLLVVGTKTAPKFYSRVMLKRTSEGVRVVSTPKVRLKFDRVNLYFPVYLDDQAIPIENFRDVIRYIRVNTAPGEPIFTFPALPMIYFVSERDNPTQHDYFFGDNVPFPVQMDVIRTLEKSKVRIVVIANSPGDYFVAKGQDFTRLIWEYLRRDYYLDRRIGPYDLLRRYVASPAGATPRDDR